MFSNIKNNYKFIVTISLLTLVFAFSSCKATPEQAIVQNKRNSNLMDLIKNARPNPADSSMLVGKHIKEQFQNKTNTVSIDIDADIKLPNANKLSAVKATPKILKQQDIKQIIDTLMGNQYLYQYNDQLTKSDIEQIIIDLKRQKSEDKEKNNVTLPANGATPLSPEQYDDIIKDYESMYSEAPSSKDMIAFDYSQLDMKAGYNLHAQTEPVNGLYQEIMFSYSPLTGSEVQFRNPAFIPHTYKRTYDKRPEGLTLTEEAAVAQAKKIIGELGLDEMEVVSAVADVSIVDYYNYHFLTESKQVPYYQITFARSIANVPTNYDYRYFQEVKKDEYSYMSYYEYLYVFINDDGLLSFEWYCPTEITEVLNDDVGLLDFNRILEIAKQQISVENAFFEDPQIDGMTAQIDTIQLGMMRIRIPDEPSGYMYVPVWDFIGKYKYHYKVNKPDWPSMDENNWLHMDNAAINTLTVNAIDGTIIDRNKGY